MLVKTIDIDGKSVPFAASASLVFKYRTAFGSDIFHDIPVTSQDKSKIAEGDVMISALRLAWLMAKMADPQIPDTPEEWLDSFEVFPLQDVLSQALTLWTESMGTTVPRPKKKR